MGRKSIQNLSTSILLFMLLICCAWGLFHYREAIMFPLTWEKYKKEKQAKVVECSITSSIGKKHVVKMDMAIPYEDDKQRIELQSKLPKIKHDFLIRIDQKDMDRWISTGNFDTLKVELLRIINRHSEKPIKTFYFNAFNW